VSGAAAARPWLASALLWALASCNPYSDRLPSPRCGTARHCLPGEACLSGHCRAEGSVELRVAGPVDTVRAIVVAVPRDVTSVATSPLIRRVAETARAVPVPRGGASTVRFDALPRLALWALVWDGARETPCAGTPHALVPLPETVEAGATLYLARPWTGECWRRPRPLHHADRIMFERRGEALVRPLRQ